VLDFIVLALATWRLTSFLVWEDGPLEVFARTRRLFGVCYDYQNQPYGSNWFAKGVICPACASVWFGAFWAILYFFWPGCVWLALPFALSAGAVLLERMTDV
jgi:hypothetical protein